MSTIPLVREHSPRALIAAIVSAILVSIVIGSPDTDRAHAATAALVCPPAAGESSVPPSDVTRPETADTLAVRSTTGVAATTYAGMMLPQAVVADPSVGRTYIAFYAPDPGGTSSSPKPVKMIVAAVDGTGVVVQRTVLANGSGTPVLFSQGAATETDSNGNVNDSHNNIAMEIDSAGFLHVAGNTHNNDLLYWRSTSAHSVATMGYKSTLPGVKHFPNGVSILAASKDRVASNPEFSIGPAGTLFLGFRHWMSGDGSFMLYRYDTGSKVWSSVSGSVAVPNGNPAYAYTEGRPLLEGRAQGVDRTTTMSPYTLGPVAGPDRTYWLVWSWRDLAESADSNSRISVARSTDLVAWYTVAGVRLPATIDYSLVDRSTAYRGLVVDEVSVRGGGLLNNQIAIGWDANKRPVISSFKYAGTSEGRTTQLFVSRPNGLATSWIGTQVSRWTGTYDLGAGVVANTLQTSGSGATLEADGTLTLDYQCNRVSRTITVKPGSFAGSLVVLSDRYATSSDVPLAADRLAPGSSATLAPRHAVSRPFTIDGERWRWVLAWDAGPYIMNGTTPKKGSFPLAGTALRLYRVAAP